MWTNFALASPWVSFTFKMSLSAFPTSLTKSTFKLNFSSGNGGMDNKMENSSNERTPGKRAF